MELSWYNLHVATVHEHSTAPPSPSPSPSPRAEPIHPRPSAVLEAKRIRRTQRMYVCMYVPVLCIVYCTYARTRGLYPPNPIQPHPGGRGARHTYAEEAIQLYSASASSRRSRHNTAPPPQPSRPSAPLPAAPPPRSARRRSWRGSPACGCGRRRSGRSAGARRCRSRAARALVLWWWWSWWWLWLGGGIVARRRERRCEGRGEWLVRLWLRRLFLLLLLLWRMHGVWRCWVPCVSRSVGRSVGCL